MALVFRLGWIALAYQTFDQIYCISWPLHRDNHFAWSLKLSSPCSPLPIKTRPDVMASLAS